MKKFIAVFMSLLVLLSILPTAQASAKENIKEDMQAMIEMGIIKGSNGLYYPQNNVTRAEFASFLHRALELPDGPHVFKDVGKSSALAKGINAAAAAGIVKGTTSTTFSPDSKITREHMAVMIHRALVYKNVPVKQTQLAFTDTATLKAESKSAIQNMVGYKIILGQHVNGKYVFRPKDNATRQDAASFIYRTLNVLKVQNPPVEQGIYSIGTVTKSGVTPGNTKYKTYAEAVAAWKTGTDTVILQGDKVVKMDKGIVVAQAPSSNPDVLPETKIYKSKTFTTANIYSGIEYNRELEYVSSDETTIHVKLAGADGYVKQSDAKLIPETMNDKQNYYTVDSGGNLIHYVYNYSTNTWFTPFSYGIPASGMKQGTKYYSWDGQTFTTENGSGVADIRQYFNVLPFRTSTKYTAADLNNIIKSEVAAREKLYKSNPTAYARYKDASTKSKVLGLGDKLKEVEASSKINAFIILAHALHESDYGMSSIAQTKNNLFGIDISDGSTSGGKVYSSPEANVDSYVAVLNKSYVPVSNGYAENGGFLGNKYLGVNMRYASDPYWGEKIAGLMLKLDKAYGGKDFVNNSNPYDIYEVIVPANVNGGKLNVRAEADAKSELLYQYRAGYMVASISTETINGTTWHRILSDNTTEKYAYISAHGVTDRYIEKVNIAK